MANIVEIADFTGEFQLQSDTYSDAKFDIIRDEHSNTAIYELLGGELGTLFLADLDANGVPQTARFTDIYDAFVIDESPGINQSKGIKEYIKGIVYFYFARNNPFIVSLGGNSITKAQNSNNNINPNYIVRIYNNSIVIGKNVQWYIANNSATYPEYNGQYLNYNSGL